MLRVAALVIVAAGLVGCGSSTTRTPTQPSGEGGHYKALRPYQINGRWYEPYYDPTYREVGVASWYGEPFHGRKTANGERYDKRRLSAAHPTLPLPSLARVTNLENGRTIEVRVNDRGPFAGNRLIDMSEAAAEVLGFKSQGLARVEVAFLGLADSSGTPPTPTRRQTRTQTAAVAPPLAPSPAATRVAATTPTVCGLYLQVGAFTQPVRAHAAAATLQGRFAPNVRAQAIRQRDVTRIRVGPFDGLDAAHRALATVAQQGYGEAFIMGVNDANGRCRRGTA